MKDEKQVASNFNKRKAETLLLNDDGAQARRKTVYVT